MWKVRQLLKGCRSQLSCPLHTNTLSPPSPAPSSNRQTEENEKSRRHTNQRPLPFTPAQYWLNSKKVWSRSEQNASLLRLFSFEREEDSVKRESASVDDDYGFGDDHNYSHRGRRPDHEHDHFHFRCRCSFGEWLGYTTMVAATIHLSRVVHLLPNRNEKSETLEQATNESKLSRTSKLRRVKKNFQARWYRLVFRVAPVLFPDLFKQWYVLPQISCDQFSTLSSISQGSQNVDTINGKYPTQAILQYDCQSSGQSSSVSQTSSARSSSDFAVQTDSCDFGTPFDDLVNDAGKRLANVGRLSDVALEHAIGVDLLKRQLYDEAIDYLLGAARCGHAGALYNLGICYSKGYGVRRDLTKAVELWRTAADKGHGLSKYQMGACHARGLGGLAMDLDRAVRYMEAAATAGVPEAKTYLAAHEYKQGHLEGALDLLRQAVSSGDKKAQDILEAWPAKNLTSQDHDKSTRGYTVTFANQAADVAAVSSLATTKRTDSNIQRQRFWGGDNSTEGSSAFSLCQNEAGPSDNGSSSVIFCDDLSSKSGKSKNDLEAKFVEQSSRVLETVASLLALGKLRRSRTAPEFRGYDMLEPVLATGNNRVEGLGGR